jgi:general L-amino acid transport system permease protein
MNAQIFAPIAPRPAPVKTEGAIAWIRSNLFGDWKTTLGTLLVGAILLKILPPFLQWAVVSAVWVPDYTKCDVGHAGACWGVIAEKYRII